jgi:hypothetical protein
MKAVVRVGHAQGRARVCWTGTDGEPVRGQWQSEPQATAMVELFKILLGERLCWLEFLH